MYHKRKLSKLYHLLTLECHCVFRYVSHGVLCRGVEDIHCEVVGVGADVRFCVGYVH